jgi:hypothetical protein
LAGTDGPDWLPCLLYIRDNENIRVFGQREVLDDMLLKATKSSGECNELVRSQILLVKHEYGVFQKGFMNGREDIAAVGACKVDTRHLSAQSAAQTFEVNTVAVHFAGNFLRDGATMAATLYCYLFYNA